MHAIVLTLSAEGHPRTASFVYGPFETPPDAEDEGRRLTNLATLFGFGAQSCVIPEQDEPSRSIITPATTAAELFQQWSNMFSCARGGT